MASFVFSGKVESRMAFLTPLVIITGSFPNLKFIKCVFVHGALAHCVICECVCLLFTRHNLDPLEEFERRMRMREEHKKRSLLRQRSPRSRSYSRSRSRSRSRSMRSPRSRTPLSRTRSRTRSRTPRRSLSRTPPLKSRKFTRSRSRTPR